MKKIMFKFRVWLANRLVRMAIRIRPREVNQMMQSMQDSMIYGNGFTRIDPKEVFKV